MRATAAALGRDKDTAFEPHPHGLRARDVPNGWGGASGGFRASLRRSASAAASQDCYGGIVPDDSDVHVGVMPRRTRGGGDEDLRRLRVGPYAIACLPGFSPLTYPFHLAYPTRRHVSNHLRVFIDWADDLFRRLA